MARRCAFSPMSGAARTPDNPDSFLPAVVRNSICTHSHATGLMGAVLHALCVARALGAGRCPSPSELDTAIEVAERPPEIMANDTELGYWRRAFERESGPFRRCLSARGTAYPRCASSSLA